MTFVAIFLFVSCATVVLGQYAYYDFRPRNQTDDLHSLLRGYGFLRKHWLPLCVFGCYAIFFAVAALASRGQISRNVAAWATIGSAIVCGLLVIAGLFSYYKLSGLLERHSGWLKLLLSLIVLSATILATSFADFRIQQLTGENPEDFSSARFSLIFLYNIWLWLLILSAACVPVAGTLLIHLFWRLAPFLLPRARAFNGLRRLLKVRASLRSRIAPWKTMKKLP